MKKLIIASALFALTALPALASPLMQVLWEGEYRGESLIVYIQNGKTIWVSDTNAGEINCKKKEVTHGLGVFDADLKNLLIAKGCR